MRLAKTLLALLFAGAVSLQSGVAQAQQALTFSGWTADGQAVLHDDNAEQYFQCKPARFNSAKAAPENGCTPCKSQKECPAKGKPVAAAASEDGKLRVEQAKDHGGFVVFTFEGAEPKRMALRATKKARMTTWFRPDGKALALMVSDAEDRFFVIDPETLKTGKSSK